MGRTELAAARVVEVDRGTELVEELGVAAEELVLVAAGWAEEAAGEEAVCAGRLAAVEAVAVGRDAVAVDGVAPLEAVAVGRAVAAATGVAVEDAVAPGREADVSLRVVEAAGRPVKEDAEDVWEADAGRGDELAAGVPVGREAAEEEDGVVLIGVASFCGFLL